MKKNTRNLLTLILLIVTFLISGCGEKKEKTVKDTLVYGQLTDPKTLDPQISTDQYSQNAIAQIYDRLFEINESNGEPVLSLAKSYERINDKTLAITLNENVRFHNGDYLTAEDVKFTLERAMNSPRVGHLYKLIDNIEIVDDHNLIITTKETFAPLLNHLSHKSSSVLNKEVFEKIGEEEYFQNPVGTGAYKVKSWDLGDKITLEAVPKYFKGDAKIKYIIIKTVPEENSKVIGLETGELDMVLDVPAIAWDSILSSDTMDIKTGPSTTTAYMGLNTQKGILTDKDVRKAIAMAVDKDAIIDTIFLGKVTKAEQFISPVVFGHNKNAKSLPFDPEAAKKIIEEKGLVGAPLKIVVSSPERVQMATIVQAQLKNIGLDLTIELLEWGTFLAETGNGNVDMFIMGWGPSTYDGDYGYYPNLHSNQLGSDGNRAFFVNKEMDTYLDLAKSELDTEKRKEYYDKIREIIVEENPIVPLYHGNSTYGIRKNLKNITPAGYPEFYKYEFSN